MFEFDVFLSHSSKDKPVVFEIAQKLREDGIRVWLDDWRIRPGDNIPMKIEHGLEYSRVLVLCMSAHATDSDWSQMEAQTFRFRDPLNRDRRFIPLRLDDTPLRGSLAMIAYIDWRHPVQERAYSALREACQPPADEENAESLGQNFVSFSSADETEVLSGAFSPDRSLALTGGGQAAVKLWDIQSGTVLRTFHGHSLNVWAVAWSPDGRFAVSGGDDRTLRLWDVTTGKCLRELEGHTNSVSCVAWSKDQTLILSGADDGTIRLWDTASGACLRTFSAQASNGVFGLSMSSDQRRILSGSRDNTIYVWDAESGKRLRVLEGHTGQLRTVIWSPDQRHALSGGEDRTIRLWDLDTGQCLRVFHGHHDYVWSLAWSVDQRFILSGSADTTVRLWDTSTGKCLRVLDGHDDDIRLVAWSRDQQYAFSGDSSGTFRSWDLSDIITATTPSDPVAIPAVLSALPQYTNAKVLLVGDSSAGKTGLSKVLAGESWQPSDSTVGAWATQWKLPGIETGEAEREIWLWDFGGQADQRLIHQLYFDETAAAVLVFDGQKEDVFETLGQWDRDLARASGKPFSKLLVAGRIDAGGLRVSRQQVETFARERGFAAFLETSAKDGTGCADLQKAIVECIDWEEIPWRSSPLLFRQLKEEIVRLKDEGRVLLRFNELRETLRIRLTGSVSQFSDEELKAVVGLLCGPGIVWDLAFGSWVLLQPECINAYAQAVIQTLREDKHERGCITEELVLKGNISFRPSMQRLAAEEERFILLAMHQILVERGLCLRVQTGDGPVLIFPSYYRRERPELVGHPAVLVSYQFNGFLDDIYATLVVRLHHTAPFDQDQLWRYAADFKTLTGKQLGVKLTRRAEGAGELDVYFDPAIPNEEKIIFSKYVHEHLLQNAQDVVRFRHYVCPYCGTPVGNRDIAMQRLNEGKSDIACVKCDDPNRRVPLWDVLEDLFASPDLKQRVRDLQLESARILDSESKERVLVGDVISTVALAGQISREFSVSDHGIDMEIEFKSDSGEATGRKVYLQLKSGDSHLTRRKKDGAEIFAIHEKRHAEYWQQQAFPVYLIIRDSRGDIRWMEIRDHLRRVAQGSRFPRSIVFTGQRFDVMSVRRWREESLKT
ncbi:TIR domain-containing protein [Magnetospirillum fulvum]|uniref:Small GTP-binding protein domain-containing protein n=1 Tax=Magnetospirillum fulvum TaxID=1082 RepID=A0A1H6I2Z4_MAGFU|nr:TIR domain-containing protein [Magnetospirillum fulvum]SEH41863.1 small GTP-binding protein domain-containing protein [Magnetospirillum fulvum]